MPNCGKCENWDFYCFQTEGDHFGFCRPKWDSTKTSAGDGSAKYALSSKCDVETHNA